MRAKTNTRSFSTTSPGPGNYQPNVAQTHEPQTYSMGARRNPKKEMNVALGPGAYNHEADAIN